MGRSSSGGMGEGEGSTGGGDSIVFFRKGIVRSEGLRFGFGL